MEFLVLFLLFALLVRIPPNQDRFKSSGYKDASGHSFFETVFDPGRNGEYLAYSCLERFGEEHPEVLKAKNKHNSNNDSYD